MIWPVGYSTCDDCSDDTDYFISLIPAFSTWFGFTWSFGDPGNTRMIIGTKVSPIFLFVLGAAVNASMGVDIPLGSSLSLRPEISTQFAIFAEYEDLGELERSIAWFTAGGGIGLVY